MPLDTAATAAVELEVDALGDAVVELADDEATGAAQAAHQEAAAASDRCEEGEVVVENALLIRSQADVPPEERSYGPLILWAGAEGRVPYLLFRPTRFSLEELWREPVHKRMSAPWNLSVTFYRTESKLLQTILEDHGFSAVPTRDCNLLW